jgi:hypothetical protein
VSKLYGAPAFREYREAVRGYRPLTGSVATGSVATGSVATGFVAAVAVAVVGAEAAVPVLVVVPGSAGAALVLAMVLLTAFTVAMGRAVRRGVRTACRCFGATARAPGRASLARNGILLAVAAAGLVARSAGVPAVPAAGVALCLSAAVVLATVLIFLDDLVSVVVPTG